MRFVCRRVFFKRPSRCRDWPTAAGEGDWPTLSREVVSELGVSSLRVSSLRVDSGVPDDQEVEWDDSFWDGNDVVVSYVQCAEEDSFEILCSYRKKDKGRGKQKENQRRKRRKKEKKKQKRCDCLPGWSATAEINTLYKRKADKVQPSNQPRDDGEGPGGETFWKLPFLANEAELLKTHKPELYDNWFYPRIASSPPNARLTPARLEAILAERVGEEINEAERRALAEVLTRREMALAWSMADISRFKDEVVPS